MVVKVQLTQRYSFQLKKFEKYDTKIKNIKLDMLYHTQKI